MHCMHDFLAGSRGRKSELITISDDSDEEPVNLVPRSPVLVPDDGDDDDIAILEVVTLRLCRTSGFKVALV